MHKGCYFFISNTFFLYILLSYKFRLTNAETRELKQNFDYWVWTHHYWTSL